MRCASEFASIAASLLIFLAVTMEVCLWGDPIPRETSESSALQQGLASLALPFTIPLLVVVVTALISERVPLEHEPLKGTLALQSYWLESKLIQFVSRVANVLAEQHVEERLQDCRAIESRLLDRYFRQDEAVSVAHVGAKR
jgi:hypothetical protein